MITSRPNLSADFKINKEDLFGRGSYQRESDFCETWTSPGGKAFGVCEVTASRPSQEDAMSASEEAVKDFGTLPFADQEVIFHEAFRQIQTEYGQAPNMGTTACCAVSWVDEQHTLHVTTANLGDSSAYVVITDAEHKVVTFLHLNELHQARILSEKERITFLGGVVALNRLNADLAISRAFGDTRHADKGISHTPDVTEFTAQLQPGQQVFIVVTCDGMDTIKNKIGMYVANCSTTCGLAEIANFLVKTAYQVNKSDNISTIIFKADNTPASALMLDGHGGADVSAKIATVFYSVLAKVAGNKDTAWLAACKERMLAEREYIRNGILSMRDISQKKLTAIKDVMDFYLQKIKGTPAFEVYLDANMSHAVAIPNQRNGYSLVFATDTHKDAILQIIEIGQKHAVYLWKTKCYESDGHLKECRTMFTFTESEPVTESFHTIMKEVLPMLAARQLIQLDNDYIWVKANTPTLFAPPLAPEKTTNLAQAANITMDKFN